MPVDIRANDLMHWQTTLVTRGTDQIARGITSDKAALVSPRVVSFKEGQLGFDKGLLVRDPDGHALLMIER
jgi:hypothetical protein